MRKFSATKAGINLFRHLTLFILLILLCQSIWAQTNITKEDLARHKGVKEEFMKRRSEAIAQLRGVTKDQPFDPTKRVDAINFMERQRAQRASAGRATPDAVWTEIGPNPIPNGQVGTGPQLAVSGRTISIAVHPTNPDIVYVGTAQGGLYRSTNGGTTWTPLMDNAMSLAIGTIAISPSSPETIYVGTGEPNFSADSYFGVGVYRIDNASSATPTLTGPLNDDAVNADVFTGRAISRILVHPTNPAIIFVSTASGIGGIGGTTPGVLPSQGIYRSTDATSADPTFTKLTGLAGNANASVRDMVLDPLNPDLLICSQTGIYTSTNALSASPTFTQTQPSTGVFTEFAIQHTSGPNPTIYAASGFGGGTVLMSIDGGTTWTQQIDNNFCTPQCFYDIAVAVDPNDPTRVYLGGAPAFVFGFSTNSGVSFTTSASGLHVDSHVIGVSSSTPSTIYFGSDGGIYKSTNSGSTWTSINNTTFRATQFMGLAVHPSDPNYTIGGTQDNGTNMYRPDATWFRVDFGDGGYAVIDQNAANTTTVDMYHTYFNSGTLQGYGTVSTTAGAVEGAWAFRGCNGVAGNGIPCGGAVLFYAPLEQGPGNPNTIYYGANILYRSTDKGLNHTAVSQNLTNPISAIGISPQNDNVRIVGQNNGGLFGTTTGSATLTNLDAGNVIPNGFIARTVIDPQNVNTAYVTLSAFGVVNIWKTTNLNAGSPTWTAITSGIPQVPVNAFVVDHTNSNNLYAGTDIGVYASSDGGATWSPLGTALPIVAVFDMAITAGSQLRIATHGRGMWQHPVTLTTAPTVTINQAGAQPDPTSTSPINFTVVFSENVTGFATGDITPTGTAGATTATITGGPATYNVAVSGMTGSGTVIATVPAGVATGAISILPNVASTSTDNQVTFNASCNISSVSFANASACNNNGTPSNPADDYFTADVTVNFVNAPATGLLQFEAGGDALAGGGALSVSVTGLTSPHIFTGVRFKADGTPTVVELEFSAEPTTCVRTATGPTVSSCSAAVTNDNCANAFPIACGGTASGTTATATLDGPAASCTGGSVAPDVWYTIVGTGGAITASLCGSAYDTKIDVYTGACGSLTNIGGCNDDFCGLQSEMTWTSTLGTTYRIRVHGFAGATGAYTLNVTCAAVGPANDNCANAIPIACGGTASGSTALATIDGPGASCTGGSVAPDVWYTIVGTGGAITASLCGSAYDTKIDVYTGACGSLTNIGGCNDDFCGTQSQMTWTSTIGTTYRIRVHGFAGATGAFTLNVTCGPVPPPNDNCANAIPIACGGTASGSTALATIDGPATDCGGGSVAPDVWYTIVGTGNAITASLCGSGYDTQLDVYTGACGALTNIGGCNDDFCGLQSQMTWNSILGTTYRIRVHGFGGATGAFTLNVTCPASCTITCPANVTVSNQTGQCGAVVTYPAPTTTGTCGTITASPASGSFFPVGTTTVTATSTAGPTCSFTITVNDVQPPTVTTGTIASCYPTVAAAQAAALAATTATDNCPGVLTEVASTVGTCSAVVTVTTTDVAGNSTAVTYNTRIDNTPPTVTTGTIASCYPTVAAAQAAALAATNATDNCPGALPEVASTVGTCSAVITVTTTDACGNATAVTYNTRIDNTAPVITCPANVTVSCAANVPAVNTASVTATDNCPGAIVITHIGDVITNQTCANRFTVTRTYRATDGCGSFTECTQIITVNDQTAPVITCPANISVTTPVGSCTAVVNFTPTATDNCAGAVTIVSSPASGTAFPIGITTVTSTATDVCGNSSTCTFTVTVADAQLPVITAQPQNRTVCAGTNATFSVTAITSPNANGPLAYQWQQWNGSAWVNISGATASSFTVSNTTVAMNTNTFRVVITGLCTIVNSNAATLYVNPVPTVVISATPPPSLLPNQTTTLNAFTNPAGGGTFTWFFNGTAIPGVTGSSLGPIGINQLGVYRVLYTDLNGCVGTSANLDVTGAFSNQIWVYPNPNFGQFQVRFYNQVSEPATVTVFNAAGQRVYQRSLTTGGTPYTQIDIDLGLKANGVYIVQIVNGSGKLLAAKKIIVQNR